MSIKEICSNIKEKAGGGERGLSLALLLVLTASLFFGLGRLSKIEETREPVKLEYPAGNGAFSLQPTSPSKNFSSPNSDSADQAQTASIIFASKRGKKYYFDWCGEGKIVEENKIFFKTEAEAQAAGYTISSACK